MSIDRARHFADQAALSIQAGQCGLGLDLADQALQLDPSMGDAENLRGVALSLGSQPRPAEEAFLRAASMMPGSGKPFYNLAVHYYGLGNRQESLNWITRALEREPSHAQAFSLQALILEQADHLKPNLDLPFAFQGTVTKTQDDSTQPIWNLFGWSLSGAFFVAFAMGIRETVAADSSISPIVAMLFVMCYFGGLLFLGMDASKSKRSYAWAAAFGLVGCVVGWLVLPLYLVTRGKRRP